MEPTSGGSPFRVEDEPSNEELLGEQFYVDGLDEDEASESLVVEALLRMEDAAHHHRVSPPAAAIPSSARTSEANVPLQSSTQTLGPHYFVAQDQAHAADKRIAQKNDEEDDQKAAAKLFSSVHDHIEEEVLLELWRQDIEDQEACGEVHAADTTIAPMDEEDDQKVAAKLFPSNHNHIEEVMLELWKQDIEEQEEDLGNVLEDEARLLQTPAGRSWKLVERFLILWESRTSWNQDITPVSRDDVVAMAEKLIALQEQWRLSNSRIYRTRRPLTVDIGYHWTRQENLDSIQTDGLLTKSERDNLGIAAHYNGSAFGDGVYTAGNPYKFCRQRYGDIGIMVARLQGTVGHRVGATETCDTVVGHGMSMAVLKSSAQCFPIFSFHVKLIGNSDNTTHQPGKEQLHQCHVDAQKILDDFLNEGHETPVQNVFKPSCSVEPTMTLSSASMSKLRPASTLLHQHRQGIARLATGSTLNSASMSKWHNFGSSTVVIPIPTVKPIPPKEELVYTSPNSMENHSKTGKSPTASMVSLLDATLTCHGFSGQGTIVIKYLVRSGVQKAYHPNPGHPHGYFQRVAFIPGTPEGHALLKRLKNAFLRGFTFVVEPKSDAGKPSEINWGLIPHKTSLGPGGQGYPDPTYFQVANVVLDELCLSEFSC